MGMIRVHRKGYHRRNGTYVRPTNYMMRDRGKPGRTPLSKRWFPRSEEKYRLIYNGEEWNADDSVAERHRILGGLAKSRDWTPLIRRLNAIRNVSTSSKLKRSASADIKWMQDQK